MIADELTRVLLLDVPVDPDAETARSWVTEELLRPEYQNRPSLLQQFLDWLGRQFDGTVWTLDNGSATAVVVVVVAVVAAVAFYVAGPVQRSRRAASAAVIDADDERTSAQMRAAADAAATAGEWTTAVLERFRAVVRSLEERVLLDPRPGRTADEAAVAAGERLPGLGADLAQGARLFDDVCYGGVRPGPDADRTLRSLDERVRAARPVPVGAPAMAVAGSVVPASGSAVPAAGSVIPAPGSVVPASTVAADAVPAPEPARPDGPRA